VCAAVTPDTGAGSSASVTLRPARPGDADAVGEVWLASFKTALPTVALVHTDEQVRSWLRDKVLPHRETWVASADSAVVGLMVLGEDELEQLYIAPEWTGRGLGSRFMALAKDRRPGGLDLWAFEVNSGARRFYERHGFVAVETGDGSRNAEHEPDVRYSWRPGALDARRRRSSDR
jgi:GNAT superfamily N-acetyltransferase